ncbi:hypothetical protein H0H87_005729 [Tephrocybe sp. NHM501043]|nr:hypothetical protein H0H87_005729 [Tephrocybe sp. NHM501043]
MVGPIIVEASVVDPDKSHQPFVLEVTVDWSVRLISSGETLQCRIGSRTTSLELYWISEKLHPAFKNGIPIEFLRSIVDPPTSQIGSFLSHVTKRIFEGFNKRYDTTAGELFYKHHQRSLLNISVVQLLLGAAHFVTGPMGGNFALDRYLAKRYPHENVGAKFKLVNCYDQAGMVELACSLSQDTTWLFLQPFGYIKPTRLVGVSEWQVNNPFFTRDNPPTPAMIGQTDPRRTRFGNHAFNGYSQILNTPVYDACSGPHLGTENQKQYQENAIDDIHPPFPPGISSSAGTVQIGRGVDGINGHPGRPYAAAPLPNFAYDPDAYPTVARGNWARLDTWLKPTLGNTWDVDYREISVGDTVTRAFWQIFDTNTPDDMIRVQVDTFSVVDEDDQLDMESSAAAAAGYKEDLLMSTQLADAWTSGTLTDSEECLQYNDNVAAGRIVTVVRNLVIDIAGMASTKELHPLVLKLVQRDTVARDSSGASDPLLRPILQLLKVSDQATLSNSKTITTDIDSHFHVIFSVSRDIVAATAICENGGALLDRYEIDNVANEATLFLIADKVGRHDVRVGVVDSETMFRASYDLEIEVDD